MYTRREQIAADAGVVLRRDVQHRAGRDRGIDGVAAPPQDLEPRLGGERIAGCDHAVPGEDLGPSPGPATLRARTPVPP
jgi:hypothetical protein